LPGLTGRIPDFIRIVWLCTKFTGVETISSNVIGPVADDKNTSTLLSRAIPIEYGHTRVMSYNILAGE
jgi:hypothetical protein